MVVMRYLIALAFPPALAAGNPVTFNKQVAPVIYKNCSECHRPGEAAPFPLHFLSGCGEEGATDRGRHFIPPDAFVEGGAGIVSLSRRAPPEGQ